MLKKEMIPGGLKIKKEVSVKKNYSDPLEYAVQEKEKFLLQKKDMINDG